MSTVTIRVWVEKGFRNQDIQAEEVMQRSDWDAMTPPERRRLCDEMLFDLITTGREALDEHGNELDWDAPDRCKKPKESEREALLAVARAADEMSPNEMSQTLAAALSHPAVRALLDRDRDREREHDESELECKARAPR